MLCFRRTSCHGGGSPRTSHRLWCCPRSLSRGAGGGFCERLTACDVALDHLVAGRSGGVLRTSHCFWCCTQSLSWGVSAGFLLCKCTMFSFCGWHLSWERYIETREILLFFKPTETCVGSHQLQQLHFLCAWWQSAPSLPHPIPIDGILLSLHSLWCVFNPLFLSLWSHWRLFCGLNPNIW